MKAEDTMTRRIIYVDPNESLLDAWILMKQFDIRHLVVLEEDRVQGILSDRDVLRWSKARGAQLDVPDIPVLEVMASYVLTCQPEHTIADIANLMIQHKVDAVPIVDPNGYLRGLVTSTDLLQLLTHPKSPDHSPIDIPILDQLVDWEKYNLNELQRDG